MEGLVIGLDLNDDYSQISCNEKEKSWTVPTVICRRKEKETWLIGEEAYAATLLGEGVIVDKLLKMVRKEGTSTIGGICYTGTDLLKIFLKKLLDCPFKEFHTDQVEQLVITMHGTDAKVTDCLMYCADYLNIPMGMVEEIFGSDACKDINHEERSAGKLFAEDAVIRNGKAKTVYNRVAVDKFTGGVRNGAKFDAMPVEGNVRIKVSLVDSDRNQKAHIGLILLALRDIFSERVAIGGGNNVGYGRIRGKEIRVQDGERNCIISMEDWNRSDAAEYVKILLAERTDITGEME